MKIYIDQVSKCQALGYKIYLTTKRLEVLGVSFIQIILRKVIDFFYLLMAEVKKV